MIYHSTFIGRAGPKHKGRISRFLANKCSIASRIDCYSDNPTAKFGEALRGQVEERLNFFETGAAPSKNADTMRKVLADLALDDEDDDGDVEMKEMTTLEISPKKKKEKKDKKRKSDDMDVDEDEEPATKKVKLSKEEKKALKKAEKAKAKAAAAEAVSTLFTLTCIFLIFCRARTHRRSRKRKRRRRRRRRHNLALLAFLFSLLSVLSILSLYIGLQAIIRCKNLRALCELWVYGVVGFDECFAWWRVDNRNILCVHSSRNCT